MNIQIKSVKGDAIKPYIKELAHLRIKIFRDFPYLYDGSLLGADRESLKPMVFWLREID